MRGARKWFIILVVLSFGSAVSVFGQLQPGSVVINEVAWMGTSSSLTADEWIELYNTTNQAINLTGWKLEAADGTPNITLSGTIPANGFFLLERTDDTTVSDITADQIYTGALENDPDAETLFLKDPSGNVIDTANGDGGGWPAGDNTTKSTMERINPLAPDSDTNWCTNDGIIRNGRDANKNPINGTPKAQNSCFVLKGDVDGDGDADLFDIIKIARFLIGLETFTPAQQAAADADGDWDVDLADIIRIADFLVGNITSLSKTVNTFARSHVDTAKVKLESKTLPLGDEVGLKLSATPGLAGIQVGPEGRLRFDPAVIHVAEMKGVWPYRVLASRIDNEAGELKFVVAALGEETKDRLQVHKLTSSQVPVVELRVRGVGEAGQGSRLMLNLDDAINRQGQKLEVEIEPGWVVLGEAAPLRVEAVKLMPNPIRRSHQAMSFIVEGAGIKSIEVEIFDLAGRRVFASGEVLGNMLEWRLQNDQGKVLANGVYLYVITVRGFDEKVIRSAVKKLVILR